MVIDSNWTDYVDFELAYFGDPRREAVRDQRDLPGFGSGVRLVASSAMSSGQGNRLINWVIHDTADNVFKADKAHPTEFYGVLNYNYRLLYDTPKVKRVGGHGFYLRNRTRRQGGLPFVLEGDRRQRPAAILARKHHRRRTNLVAGFGASSLAFQDYGTCSCAMHRNWLFDGNFFLGSTLSGGCSAHANYTLGTRNQILTNNWLAGYTAGYLALGCDGVTVDSNYFFRSMHSPADPYFAKRSPIYFSQQRGKEVNPCRAGVTFTNNTYWGNPNLVDAGTTDDDINGFRSSWYPYGGNVYLDNGSTPGRNFTAVRPNTYRAGSCNVYVANFLDATSVTVDLTACGLAEGASYEIRSIYDYMGAPVATGRFSNGNPSVSFPMTTDANPISDSVGHRTAGAPGSFDMTYSLTRAGGNVFRNAFVVLTVSRGVVPPPAGSKATPTP